MLSTSSRTKVPHYWEDFPDSGLTPKPLRIARHRKSNQSDPVTLTRLPSLPNGRTEGDHSQRNQRNDFTNLGKHRRIGPNFLNVATQETRPDTLIAKEPLASAEDVYADLPRFAFMDTVLGSHAYARAAKIESRPVSIRIVTTGIIERSGLSGRAHKSSSMASVPTSFWNPRRAVTASRGVPRTMDSTIGIQDHVLREKPSAKQRLMNRVMSGLTNRSLSSSAASNDIYRKFDRPRDDTQCQNQQNNGAIANIRRSISSAGTVEYSGSELESVLSAFPTPPTTASPSPTSPSMSRDVSASSPILQQYRILREPETITTMEPQITLTAEYDHLSSHGEETMLVAIDVEGTLSGTISGMDSWSHRFGVDMVVVVDNSLHTSPATLMVSCETGRFLASILNVATDRMAIICTSAFDVNGSGSSLNTSLAPIKPKDIKNALDSVTCSSERSTVDTWSRTILHAQNLLLQSIMPDPSRDMNRDTFGHILLLTANANEIPSQLLAHDRLQIHIICPAIVPWSKIQTIAAEGWMLRSLSSCEPRAVSATKDTDPKSLFNKLRVLVSYARRGKLLGRLYDVVLDITPGPNCSIQGIMGSSQWPIINLGEPHTVLVKMHVRTPKARGYSLYPNSDKSTKAAPRDDIVGELDEMLGLSAVKLLTATLRYKHSLLSQNIVCSVTAHCQLKSQILCPDQSKTQAPKFPLLPACKALVQNRLAHHLATHGLPKYALSSVQREFGELCSPSSCPPYISLIIKELKFRSRLMDRIEIDLSPRKPGLESSNQEADRISDCHARGLDRAMYYRPEDWIAEAIDEGVSSNEEVQLAVLSSGKQNRTENFRPKNWLYGEINSEEDIWDDVDNTSKPGQQSKTKQILDCKQWAG